MLLTGFHHSVSYLNNVRIQTPGIRYQLHTMSGPLVQAEPIGGHGGLATAGDAALVETVGHVHPGGIHGAEQLSRISRLLRPTVMSLITSSAWAMMLRGRLAWQRDPGKPGDLLGQRTGAQFGAAKGRPRRRGPRP
jgi:hypothetical protein